MATLEKKARPEKINDPVFIEIRKQTTKSKRAKRKKPETTTTEKKKKKKPKALAHLV